MYHRWAAIGALAVLASCGADVATNSGGGSERYPHEPAGMTRIVEHSMNVIPGAADSVGVQYAASGASWRTWEQTNLHIVDDATAPVSSAKVAEIRWPQGLDDGERNGSFFQGIFGHDYRDLYVSIRFKLVGDTFENQNTGTKLLGYVSYGGYDRQNQFFWLLKEEGYCDGDGPGGVRSGPFQLESRVSVYYTQYLSDGDPSYHCPSRDVQYLGNNQGTGLTIRPGEWVHMEAYFRLNTRNANGTYNRNGVLRQWINGQLVQDYRNVDWLTPETAKVGDHGFHILHFDPIWGGNSGQIRTRDDRMLIDHVYVSGVRQ